MSNIVINLALADFGINSYTFNKLTLKELLYLTNKQLYNNQSEQLLISQRILLTNKKKVRFSSTVKIYEHNYNVSGSMCKKSITSNAIFP